MWRDHLTQIIVFAALFLRVSALGFLAARWRRTGSLDHLDEWGLGDRRFGGWIILQTLPSVGIGLYTRWFHRSALIAGWVAGMAAGMWMLYQIPNPATKHEHFGGSAIALSKLGFDSPRTLYVGFLAVAVNLVARGLHR